MCKSHAKAQYPYDAFFSYATDPDHDLVRELEKFLEGFHETPTPAHVELRPLEICVDGSDFTLPKSIVKNDPSVELPELIQAYLSSSKYLVVFCSENVRSSRWVQEEVEWFLKHRQLRHILVAITEGHDPSAHPEQVFPDALIRAKLNKRPWYDFRGAPSRNEPEWKKVRDFDDNKVRLAADLLGLSAGKILPSWYREKARLEAARAEQANVERLTTLGVALVKDGDAETAIISDVAQINSEIADRIAQRESIRRVQFPWSSKALRFRSLNKLLSADSLDLSGSQLTNPVVLSGLENIERLDLSNTPLESLSALTLIPNLRSLNVSRCPRLKDFRPLAEMSRLRELDVSSNTAFEDLSPIEHLPLLRALNVDGVGKHPARLNGRSLAAVRKLESLEYLSLNATRVYPHDLKALADLTGLRILLLDGNESITSLAPLASLTGLETLDLGYAGLGEFDSLGGGVAPLRALSALRELRLWNAELVDLEGIGDLSNLEILDISGNQITSLAPIQSLKKLRVLKAESNRFDCVDVLEDLPDLEQLSLSGNIRDFTPLRKLTNLRILDLAHSNIQDLEPLAGLHKLRELNISRTPAKSYKPLARLQNLVHLNVYHSDGSLGPLQALRKLRLLVVPHGWGDRKQLDSLRKRRKRLAIHMPDLYDPHPDPRPDISGIRVNGRLTRFQIGASGLIVVSPDDKETQ